MKICVINGSPRGKYSTTLHTCLYLEKKFPEHSFTYLPVANLLRGLEQDMTPALTYLKDADLLLFSYPVYTFIAPSQLHRFMELLKASGFDLSGKFATQITTSKHFYDVTAHRYIEDNCHDLGLKVIHGLSADMEDLLSETGQKEAADFLRYAAHCVEHDLFEPAPAPSRNTPVLSDKVAVYSAAAAEQKAAAGEKAPANSKSAGAYDTVIVADLRENDDALRAKIDDFRRVYPHPARVVNLADYPFQGGCLGCFNCAGDGKCIYKDGFDSFLRETIQTADAIVYAFTIRDHSMGARFKMYDDRQFCNGHRTVTEGMPFAYIVNGDYEAEPNLRTIIEARAEVGHNFLAGVATDEASLQHTVQRLCYSLENKFVTPRNFYGVGGMKIFRDLIWIMRGLMKADHDFYKAHGVYDFPQKQRGKMIAMCFLGSLVRNPKIKSKMGNKMNEGMVAPYKKLIDSLK